MESRNGTALALVVSAVLVGAVGYASRDVTATATVALLLVTAWYAFTMRQTVQEMQRTRYADLRPYVTAYFSMERPPFIHIDVQNSGRTGAVDVRFGLSPAITLLGKDVERTALVTEGIPFLPPGRHLSTFVASSFEYHAAHPDEGDRVMAWDCTVSYTDPQNGERYSETFVLDLGHLTRRYYHSPTRKDGLPELVKEVKRLREDLRRLGAGREDTTTAQVYLRRTTAPPATWKRVRTLLTRLARREP